MTKIVSFEFNSQANFYSLVGSDLHIYDMIPEYISGVPKSTYDRYVKNLNNALKYEMFDDFVYAWINMIAALQAPYYAENEYQNFMNSNSDMKAGKLYKKAEEIFIGALHAYENKWMISKPKKD